jgi:hypothetical protein
MLCFILESNRPSRNAGIPAPFPAPVEVDSEVIAETSADTPLVGATAFNFL